MFNTTFIVGKVASLPDFEVLNSPVKDALMHIKVERPFPEDDGTIAFDLIPVTLWNGLAMKIKDNCEVGSIIAIKGRLMNVKDKPMFENYHVMVLRGETVDFLDYKIMKKD